MLVPGDIAPDFALPDTEGRTVRLSDFRGEDVILFNFSSW
jgi:peroxiredoxin Q/BCP